MAAVTLKDLWEGKSKIEIAELRARKAPRYQRRWREGSGRDAPQRKQSYKERQKSKAYEDEAAQLGQPKARAIRASSITVGTLLDRHLAAKTDRAPKTVEADRYHAGVARAVFGDRVVTTLDPTEIEIWAGREGTARHSRKKQLEIMRAAIRRGMRDKLVLTDPTDGIVVSLGHRELPHWSSEELMAVLNAAATDFDRTLLGVLGLMGLRAGEAISLTVGDLDDGQLTVRNSGAGTDTTKTRAGRRMLPVPGAVLPGLVQLACNRSKRSWLFPSPRIAGQHISDTYPNNALVRALTRANASRSDEPIPRINIHGLRHTFAAMALSEAECDILSVSRAMGHAKPSITLDKYGHLAPAGLAPLMASIDDLVTPFVQAPQVVQAKADPPGAPDVRPGDSEKGS